MSDAELATAYPEYPEVQTQLDTAAAQFTDTTTVEHSTTKRLRVERKVDGATVVQEESVVSQRYQRHQTAALVCQRLLERKVQAEERRLSLEYERVSRACSLRALRALAQADPRVQAFWQTWSGGVGGGSGQGQNSGGEGGDGGGVVGGRSLALGSVLHQGREAYRELFHRHWSATLALMYPCQKGDTTSLLQELHQAATGTTFFSDLLGTLQQANQFHRGRWRLQHPESAGRQKLVEFEDLRSRLASHPEPERGWLTALLDDAETWPSVKIRTLQGAAGLSVSAPRPDVQRLVILSPLADLELVQAKGVLKDLRVSQGLELRESTYLRSVVARYLEYTLSLCLGDPGVSGVSVGPGVSGVSGDPSSVPRLETDGVVEVTDVDREEFWVEHREHCRAESEGGLPAVEFFTSSDRGVTVELLRCDLGDHYLYPLPLRGYLRHLPLRRHLVLEAFPSLRASVEARAAFNQATLRERLQSQLQEPQFQELQALCQTLSRWESHLPREVVPPLVPTVAESVERAHAATQAPEAGPSPRVDLVPEQRSESHQVTWFEWLQCPKLTKVRAIRACAEALRRRSRLPDSLQDLVPTRSVVSQLSSLQDQFNRHRHPQYPTELCLVESL